MLKYKVKSYLHIFFLERSTADNSVLDADNIGRDRTVTRFPSLSPVRDTLDERVDALGEVLLIIAGKLWEKTPSFNFVQTLTHILPAPLVAIQYEVFIIRLKVM